MTNDGGLITLADEGKATQAMGVLVRLVSLGTDTAGLMDVEEIEVPSGVSIAAHRHRNADEAFFVLEGELAMRLGDRRATVTRGAFAFVPRAVVHSFDNEGNRSARFLTWQMPAWGVERFFEALSELPDGPRNVDQLMQILREYDQEPVDPLPSGS